MITRLALLGAVAAAAIGLLVAVPAGAEPSTTLILSESITFGDGHTPPVGAFTAVAGLPGCSSGTFGDRLNNFNLGGHTLVIDRTYVCANGTDSFTARMVLHNEPPNEDGVATGGGNWTIQGGTGSLAGLHGEGDASSTAFGCAPVGQLFFSCETGVSRVDATTH
jgi:hypothetical protein